MLALRFPTDALSAAEMRALASELRAAAAELSALADSREAEAAAQAARRERVRAAVQNRVQAAEALRRAILAGLVAGEPEARIAALAGVSRRTVRRARLEALAGLPAGQGHHQQQPAADDGGKAPLP